eukprot:3415703-Rhodomonas_salina.1
MQRGQEMESACSKNRSWTSDATTASARAARALAGCALHTKSKTSKRTAAALERFAPGMQGLQGRRQADTPPSG